MKPDKVRIVFNDDGCDKVQVGEEEIEFGSMADNVEVVARSLRVEGFTPSVTPLREGGLDDFVRGLRQGEVDIVFNLCEGAFENSLFEMNVAALLELYGLKFTGSGPMALGLALNKGLTKDILSRRGIPTADYCVVKDTPVRLSNGLRFPLIVKPLSEDASIGIEADAVVKNVEELEKRAEYVLHNYYQPALVEEYIEGREFNISVLGNGSEKRTLPPSEIDFSDYPEGVPRICGYEAKWITASPLYIKSPPVCPANIPDSLAGELREVALKAYDAIGCHDYARVDLRLGTDGELSVIEVNPNPDISTDAGLARAAKSAGLEYHQLIGEIVRVAAARYEEKEGPLETERVDSHKEGSQQG
jgi:D-alanine-D-alanine ligase